MDLVISVDTGVAHLAAAMGKPVWILLTKVPDWRWGHDADTVEWYPSARLFRQTIRKEWRDVLKRVKDALDEWIQKQSKDL
jgi:ADP-heptose:LPS heptosyltransferase